LSSGDLLFTYASEAPCPPPVAAALRDSVDRSCRRPLSDEELEALQRGTLQRVGTLLRVDPDRLAFVNTATQGFLFLARSLVLGPKDVIVVPDNEYPATIHPWAEAMAHGRGVLRLLASRAPWAAPDLLALEAAVREPDVKVLCLSAVNWLGQRYPLRQLAAVCRQRKVLLAIDGSQAVGMFDLSPVEADLAFFCTTFFKWAFAPVGIGCAYFRDDLRHRLRPEMVSLESASPVLPGEEPRPPGPPAPLVLAVPPPLCVAGLNAAVAFVLDADPAETERRILEIAATANDAIMTAGYWTAPRTNASRSGIVLFSVVRPPTFGSVPTAVRTCNEDVRERLRSEGIYVDVKAGLLRASFHVVHTHRDLKRLNGALRRARSVRRSSTRDKVAITPPSCPP